MHNESFRVVQAGLTEGNRSIWLSDGPLESRSGPGRGGMVLVIPELPADLTHGYSPSGTERMPTGSAVYYRLVEFMPRSMYEEHPELIPTGGNGKPVDVTHRNFGMHATSTIDIITIMAGEVWSYQDDEPGGKLLKQGDTIILRGGLHSWHNTGTEPCVAARVNVYAEGGMAEPGGFAPRATLKDG